jgi:hypothetical protein
MPVGVIDHKDGIGTNNKFKNLRDVSQALNLSNRTKPARSNKIGLLGVSWHKAAGKYWAQITINKQHRSLGFFDDPLLASEAYQKAKENVNGKA